MKGTLVHEIKIAHTEFISPHCGRFSRVSVSPFPLVLSLSPTCIAQGASTSDRSVFTYRVSFQKQDLDLVQKIEIFWSFRISILFKIKTSLRISGCFKDDSEDEGCQKIALDFQWSILLMRKHLNFQLPNLVFFLTWSAYTIILSNFKTKRCQNWLWRGLSKTDPLFQLSNQNKNHCGWHISNSNINEFSWTDGNQK